MHKNVRSLKDVHGTFTIMCTVVGGGEGGGRGDVLFSLNVNLHGSSYFEIPFHTGSDCVQFGGLINCGFGIGFRLVCET